MQKNMFLFRQFVAEKEKNNLNLTECVPEPGAQVRTGTRRASAYRNPAHTCVPEPGAHMRTGTRRAHMRTGTRRECF